MKYLRVFSDIHLDFDVRRISYDRIDQVWTPSILETDSETTLILAGDLWSDNKFFSQTKISKETWLNNVAPRFHSVIVILGNHDYWGLSLQSAVRKAREALVDGPKNVYFLEQDSIVIDNVKFLGGTLWTNFDRNEVAMSVAYNGMNDYRYITFGIDKNRRGLRPLDLLEVHRQTARFIFNNCKRDHEDQKVIVVSHMAPHEKSIDDRYRGDVMMNHSYYSDLTNSLESNKHNIDLWIHGHVHKPVDYEIAGVRVFSNPRGYEKYEGTLYDPIGLLEVDKL